MNEHKVLSKQKSAVQAHNRHKLLWWGNKILMLEKGGRARLMGTQPSGFHASQNTHIPPMVTVAQVRSEKAGTVSVAGLAGLM